MSLKSDENWQSFPCMSNRLYFLHFIIFPSHSFLPIPHFPCLLIVSIFSLFLYLLVMTFWCVGPDLQNILSPSKILFDKNKIKNKKISSPFIFTIYERVCEVDMCFVYSRLVMSDFVYTLYHCRFSILVGLK